MELLVLAELCVSLSEQSLLLEGKLTKFQPLYCLLGILAMSLAVVASEVVQSLVVISSCWHWVQM
jgi:hypothetical protein